jgi:hypothetical protein
MANQAASDPSDWPVWEENQDRLGRFLDAERERRVGRAPAWYRELCESFGNEQPVVEAVPGSSLSRLTNVQAFERGYQGGWR